MAARLRPPVDLIWGQIGAMAGGGPSDRNSSCYGGRLTVIDATDSRLEMRLEPPEKRCNPWAIAYTHMSQGDLEMSVDPIPRYYPEQAFQVRMTRKG